MAEVNRRFTAKDFALETTFQTKDIDDNGECSLIMLHNGEVALNITINSLVVQEALRMRILQQIYLDTFDRESRDALGDGFNPERFADVDAIEGVKQDAKGVKELEAYMTDPKLVRLVWAFAANAAVSLLDKLPTKLAVFCIQMEAEEAHRFITKASCTPEDTKDLNKQAAKLVQKYEASEIKRRFDLPSHGGDRRSSPDWEKEGAKEGFKLKVDVLRPLWKVAAEFYEDGDDSWMEDLKEDAAFMTHSKNCSEVPTDLLRKIADEGVNARDREPLALACEHARRELGLSEKDTETLRGFYLEGRVKRRSA